MSKFARIRFIGGPDSVNERLFVVAADQTRHYLPSRRGEWHVWERLAGTNVANYIGTKTDKDVEAEVEK